MLGTYGHHCATAAAICIVIVFNTPNYNAMQSCHFHDLDMQAVHSYTQACILIELQTCTQIQFEGHQIISSSIPVSQSFTQK